MDFLPRLLNDAKRKAARTYVKALETLDPQVANHVLAAQKEFLLAGKCFFEEEARHAEKAMEKISAKAGQSDAATAPE